MTPRQILDLRASEIRARMAELGGADDLTDESRAEVETLRKEYRDTETKITAQMISDDSPENKVTIESSEGKEVVELRERSTLAGYIDAQLGGKESDGAEAEFRSALFGDGVGGATDVPLAMLLSPAEFRDFAATPLETRAVTTVAAAAITESNQDSIAGRVFNRSVPSFLGINPVSVPVGAKGLPRLSGGTTFSQQAKSGSQAAVAGVFEGVEISPLRGTGSYEIRKEDIALLSGYEEAMRRDLREGLMNLMNDQVVNGTGTSPDVQGIRQAIAGTPATNPANVDDASEILAQFVSLIDGLYATNPSEIRAVMAGDIYQHCATQRFGTEGSSAWDYLNERLGALMVNSIIPSKDAGTSIGMALCHKSGYPERSATLAVWSNIELTTDPYTLSQAGEVRIVATMLWNFQIEAAEAFANLKIRTT